MRDEVGEPPPQLRKRRKKKSMKILKKSLKVLTLKTKTVMACFSITACNPEEDEVWAKKSSADGAQYADGVEEVAEAKSGFEGGGLLQIATEDQINVHPLLLTDGVKQSPQSETNKKSVDEYRTGLAKRALAQMVHSYGAKTDGPRFKNEKPPEVGAEFEVPTIGTEKEVRIDAQGKISIAVEAIDAAVEDEAMPKKFETGEAEQEQRRRLYPFHKFEINAGNGAQIRMQSNGAADVDVEDPVVQYSLSPGFPRSGSPGVSSFGSPASTSIYDLTSQIRVMFPNMDEQTVEKVLVSCGNNLDSAIKCLNELRLSGDQDTCRATNDPPSVQTIEFVDEAGTAEAIEAKNRAYEVAIEDGIDVLKFESVKEEKAELSIIGEAQNFHGLAEVFKNEAGEQRDISARPKIMLPDDSNELLQRKFLENKEMLNDFIAAVAQDVVKEARITDLALSAEMPSKKPMQVDNGIVITDLLPSKSYNTEIEGFKSYSQADYDNMKKHPDIEKDTGGYGTASNEVGRTAKAQIEDLRKHRICKDKFATKAVIGLQNFNIQFKTVDELIMKNKADGFKLECQEYHHITEHNTAHMPINDAAAQVDVGDPHIKGGSTIPAANQDQIEDACSKGIHLISNDNVISFRCSREGRLDDVSNLNANMEEDLTPLARKREKSDLWDLCYDFADDHEMVQLILEGSNKNLFINAFINEAVNIIGNIPPAHMKRRISPTRFKNKNNQKKIRRCRKDQILRYEADSDHG